MGNEIFKKKKNRKGYDTMRVILNIELLNKKIEINQFTFIMEC